MQPKIEEIAPPDYVEHLVGEKTYSYALQMSLEWKNTEAPLAL